MKSRPRLRTYERDPRSAGVSWPTGTASATDGSAHSVPHNRILVGEPLLERAHRGVSSNFAKRHRCAGPYLSVFPSAEYPSAVENVGEVRHSLIAADRSVAL